jgi:DNA (cytosine-5)-methyltransferase 1
VTELTCLELCAGGGGQALGLERAGFVPTGLIEIDPDCCATLRANRPDWPVRQGDITHTTGSSRGSSPALLAAGLPCTPHSRGGHQLGAADGRYLWHSALRIIAEVRPRAVMLETSSSIMIPGFDLERTRTLTALKRLDYRTTWGVIDASDFGVPQRRKRAVLIAFSDPGEFWNFIWPAPVYPGIPLTVGAALYPLAAANGWAGARYWAGRARDVAPTVTGGSTRHGGPDLGASQGKAAWRKLGIDPMGIADAAPGPDGKYARGGGRTGDAGETGLMLTVEMAARLQGFPPEWTFCGGKTARYRQVGNAFPPPAAAVIGIAIRTALTGRETA